MFKEESTVLVLAPHTDDGELGCGGTIARLVREGHNVHYVAFCSCDESLPEGIAPGTLREEVKRATRVLGIPGEQVSVLDFPVRFLAHHRQDVLQTMVELNRALKPDAVFCPTREDLHQDHGVIAAEAMRAFKAKTILGYEMPWNNISFDSNFLVKLETEDVDKKVRALAEYESQKHRPYISERFIRGLSHSRGVTIAQEYAEAFTLYRGVL